MQKSYEMEAAPRASVGKGAARATRREGRVPAVIYGGKEPPVAISLPLKELTLKILAGGFLSHVATINVDGQAIRVLPRDYQLDPVRDFPLHVDFLRITAGQTLTVDVPVHFENEEASPGLKRGGVLNIVRHAVEMAVPADDIPEFLTVDLSGLDIGDSVHISALTLPEGATPTITDRDFTIVTIAAPAGLKEEAETEEAAAEDGETA